ncbi:MAG: cell division protein FtsQ [Candidatus Pelagibacter sp.]|jgi:cell division protein FtsQ|nr:cell division protein FtsQ [Candidatus Pelagibacter sp.]MDB2500312.1 cell division protein FtsQ/DivIB [Candidatus Pelagibacter bacterium]|tara:strand:+ start:719 stop:1393 length:675 start_codon:yes stop_codon:yes gene_type:complete
MHQLIGKKKSLILYFFFLVALSTTTNKTLYKTENLFQIDNINITGIPLDNIEGLNDELYKTIEKNIFFLKKEVLKNSISEFNIVEKYSVKKIYPRELNINIKPTKFIAKISNKDDVLVGSNGKLISNKDFKKKLPSIFGKFNSNKFLELKIHLERSGFNFEDLKSLIYFSSGRWDILTNDNVLIKLPNKKIYESLHLAKKILNDDNFKMNKFIDLRISNQIIVK